MARTALEPQRVTQAGLAPVYEAANVDGHSVANDRSDVVLHVKNGGTAAITVTVVTPQTIHGLDVADRALSIPAGGEVIAGRFPRDTYGGVLTVNFSAVTSVTVAALKA